METQMDVDTGTAVDVNIVGTGMVLGIGTEIDGYGCEPQSWPGSVVMVFSRHTPFQHL